MSERSQGPASGMPARGSPASGSREPFVAGNDAATTHGAHSPSIVADAADALREAFLRQTGIEGQQLDGISFALLDNWARAQAKVELLDRWFAEHGFLDAGGAPAAAARVYFTALGAAQRALVRLSEHVRLPDPDASMVVELQTRAQP